MKTDSVKELVQAYEQKHGLYVDYARRISALITDILSTNGIRVHSVNHRAKERESLRAKVLRPSAQYSALTDITDLAGVRVITYFSDDVDRIGQLVEREFEVDGANSVDKRATLDPDRFGYLSLHFVVLLSQKRIALPEYSGFSGMKAEIQIRSVLQHAWAEIEHDLGYKGPMDLPRVTRRRFSRIAGLLELADQEFLSIRESLMDYQRVVPDQIATTPDAVSLDQVTISAFIRQDPLVAHLDEELADILRGRLVPTREPSILAPGLQALGIETIGQLGKALQMRQDTIRSFARVWATSLVRPTFRPGLSLFYLRFVMVAERQDMGLAMKVLSDIRSPKEEHHALVARVLKTYDQIKATQSDPGTG